VVAGDGLIQSPQVFEHITQVVVRLTEIRLKSDGFFEAGDGILQPSQFLERGSKVVVCLGKIGVDG